MVESDLLRARRQFAEFHLDDTIVEGGGLLLRDTNERFPGPERAEEFAAGLSEGGSWPDIDYHASVSSGWPPAVHYARMLAMWAGGHGPGATHGRREKLDTAVHRAFGYWMRHDFECRNWWYNTIGAPKQMGTLALLMGDCLTTAERTYMTETMLPRGKIGMTGQNRVWLAGNTLMLGLLKGDESLVTQAAEVIWSEIVITTGEGIQPDFSFHQHGAQQQFGNYGMAFAVEICRWGVILRETCWAMPAEKLEAFRGYMLEGLNWVTWAGRMDLSALARQFMPDSPRIKAGTIAGVMMTVARFDERHSAAYRAFVERNRPDGRNELVGNRIFWRSDYVVHRRPDFCATLKLCSKRVVGTESLNEENLSGYHLADGALYLYARGDEYDDMPPAWDWGRLPGVTCPQRAEGVPAFHSNSLETRFVGGVSDGRTGAVAFDYARDGVAVRKAWVFSDNAVTCLGVGLTSEHPDSIATTINQCRWRGPVTVRCEGRERELMEGTHRLERVEWVRHDGWSYLFPEPTTVWIELARRSGQWRRVFNNPETPDAPVEVATFTLWLDHGEKPVGAGYAYRVQLGGHPLTEAPVILTNTETLQAVRVDDQASVIFWKAGKFTGAAGVTCEADQPCVVLLNWATGAARVADPTQQLTTLGLTVGGRRREVTLPSGERAGDSVDVPFAR